MLCAETISTLELLPRVRRKVLCAVVRLLIFALTLSPRQLATHWRQSWPALLAQRHTLTEVLLALVKDLVRVTLPAILQTVIIRPSYWQDLFFRAVHLQY